MSKTYAELTAQGRKITFADGTEVPIRFGFRELGLVEAEFGSTLNLITSLGSGARGPLFGTLATALWIGSDRSLTREDFADRLDAGRFAEYMTVVDEALVEVFGTADDQGEAGAAETAATD